jgi:hypothetical protein
MAKFPHFSNGNFELLPQSAPARLPINFPVGDVGKLYALVAPSLRSGSTAFLVWRSNGLPVAMSLEDEDETGKRRFAEETSGAATAPVV